MSKLWIGYTGVVLSLGLMAASPAETSAAERTQKTPDDKVQSPKVLEKQEDDERWRRDGLGFKRGKSKVALVGYAQGDFRKFDWEPKETDLGLLRSEERELARLRVGAEAEFGDLSFEFVVDPRKSRKGDRLKDVTVGYEFSKRLAVLVGHFKPYFGLEFLTSASKTDFADRTMASDRLAPDRDWGVGLSGEFGRFSYGVGGFDGDTASPTLSAKTSGAGRLTFTPRKGFVLGASFMQGKVRPEAQIGSREPPPKGGQGRTPSGFNFWERAHVNGTRRRLGGDVEYARGPLRLRGEFTQLDEQRIGQGSTGQDIADVRGRGWNAQGSYVITGEKKGTTVEPKKSVFRGGRGALEIVARIQGLKFDDTGDPSGFAGYGNRARNIAPSGATAIEAGLNYWAANFLKLQGNAIWESYNDPLIAPVPGNQGRYFSLVGRIQIMLP